MWSECAVYRTNRAPMENASWASAFTSSEATHPITVPVRLIDPDIINPYMGRVHCRGDGKCLTCWHILFDKRDISGWRMSRWNLGRLFMYSNSLLTEQLTEGHHEVVFSLRTFSNLILYLIFNLKYTSGWITYNLKFWKIFFFLY